MKNHGSEDFGFWNIISSGFWHYVRLIGSHDPWISNPFVIRPNIDQIAAATCCRGEGKSGATECRIAYTSESRALRSYQDSDFTSARSMFARVCYIVAHFAIHIGGEYVFDIETACFSREIANFYDARSYAPSTRRTRGFNADKNFSERVCFFARNVLSRSRSSRSGSKSGTQRIVTIYSVLQVLQRSSLDDFSLSRTVATFDNVWKHCSFFLFEEDIFNLRTNCWDSLVSKIERERERGETFGMLESSEPSEYLEFPICWVSSNIRASLWSRAPRTHSLISP